MKSEKIVEILFEKLKAFNEAIDWKRFREAWKEGATFYDFYDIYVEACKKLQIKPMTLTEFERGWGFRVVLHENFREAKNEFLNLCIGFY